MVHGSVNSRYVRKNVTFNRWSVSERFTTQAPHSELPRREQTDRNMVCNDDRTLCALTTSVCSATSSRCGRSVDRDTNARAQRDGAVAQRKDCTFVSACARSLRALLRSRPSSACAIVLKGMRGAAQRQRSPKTFLHTAAQRRGVISMCTLPPRTPSILSHTHTRSLTCWSSPSSSHCFDSTPLALALFVPNNAQNLCRRTTTHDDTESARVGLATAPVWTCWNCCKSRTLEAAA